MQLTLHSLYFLDCSVPEDKDALGFEVLFSLNEMLSEVFSIMRNLGPHVVDHEWLGEVEFVVREWHCLEVKGHSSAAFDIAELVASSCCVGVSVEESRKWRSVLGEVWVVETCLPLLIEVNDVISLRGEKSSELLVSKDLIEDSNLVDGRLSSLVSNAGSSEEGEESEVQLKEGTLGEHHEAEASVAKEASSPAIVGSSQVA